MTETPTAPTTGEPRVQVHAEASDRLAALHAAYNAAKARAAAATEELKVITDGIKLELTQAQPDQRRLELVGPAGPALQLTYTERWSVDSKRLKADDPETYVRYARKSGSWVLAAARGGDE